MWKLAGSALLCMRHRDSCEKRHFNFFVKMWKVVVSASSCMRHRET
ncbi:hypothetical protein T11_11682 [Trichinella zimbabwensis]|uniref:Uncharacterized protein n=1 Tax=Trichinella zimbabwensis TaxID=268475 RepID=A0A0V1G7K7_9BILA|nr:hypothetical protein T11_11682 [Trichinella zimbabwensis]